jgi:hypothetical protein
MASEEEAREKRGCALTIVVATPGVVEDGLILLLGSQIRFRHDAGVAVLVPLSLRCCSNDLAWSRRYRS